MRYPSKRVSLLLVGLVLTGTCMRALSPARKLDVRFTYSVQEAQEFFLQLTPQASQFYFWGEILDLWFMVNYTWIFLIWSRRLQWRLPGLVLLPGLLDLGETSLILVSLKTGPIGLEMMRLFSTSKWLAAFFILSALLLGTFKRETASL
jgi:Na+-translocating ferredoxin:NAD+ oxidoreductase RnfD subunit